MNRSCRRIDKRPVYLLVVVWDSDGVLVAAVLADLKAADLWVFVLHHSNQLHYKVDWYNSAKAQTGQSAADSLMTLLSVEIQIDHSAVLVTAL